MRFVDMDCLNCDNSKSLPAGEPFDDGRIFDKDKLVCIVDEVPALVADFDLCDKHSSKVD